MKYEGRLFRPPSEAYSLIFQATIGCSHNLCTYCDMYRDKLFRVRPLDELLEELVWARTHVVGEVEKVFVADGDALAMPMTHWLPVLAAMRQGFAQLRQVSCYATAKNVLDKSADDLRQLREAGLSLLYMGPESGDPLTLKRLVKGGTVEEHAEASHRAHDAGMKISAIFLLGAGGVARTREHATGSAELVTAMDPDYVAALTLTVVPETPLARMVDNGRFELPDVHGLLLELRTLVSEARPTAALFRTNHASNYLPLGGHLPEDRGRIVEVLDRALAGEVPLRPEALRRL